MKKTMKKQTTAMLLIAPLQRQLKLKMTESQMKNQLMVVNRIQLGLMIVMSKTVEMKMMSRMKPERRKKSQKWMRVKNLLVMLMCRRHHLSYHCLMHVKQLGRLGKR